MDSTSLVLDAVTPGAPAIQDLNIFSVVRLRIADISAARPKTS